jgi:hypothetical protein
MYLFFAATALLAVLLFYSSGNVTPVQDTLPERLTDAEFWNMVTDFSEAGGYFRSDNFLSNESGYQQVIPTLKANIHPHGVYLGVGPEQNFTYIAALDAKMAFIVDIRRQNMLEHLLYKSLMELSPDRAEFLSRLFARTRPAGLSEKSSPEVLVSQFRRVRPNEALFEGTLRKVLDHLERTKHFSLSAADETGLRHVYRAFFDSGPDLSYTFLGGYAASMMMPTYGELMTETDGRHNWHFLSTEDEYRKIQRLQNDNLIVPLVGDFAGPRALRAVGAYLKEHHAVVGAFYTSNVEQYLFQDDEDWRKFYTNVSTLPVDSSSLFIRYVLNGWRTNRRSRSWLSPIPDVVSAYRRGRILRYFDVVDMSR